MGKDKDIKDKQDKQTFLQSFRKTSEKVQTKLRQNSDKAQTNFATWLQNLFPNFAPSGTETETENGKQETGNDKRETKNGKRETKNEKRKTENDTRN